jgi:hypothetical protein
MIVVGFAPKAELLKPDKLAPLIDNVMVTPLTVAPEESMIVAAFVKVPPVLGRFPNAFQASPGVPMTAGPVTPDKEPIYGLTLMRFCARRLAATQIMVKIKRRQEMRCVIAQVLIRLLLEYSISARCYSLVAEKCL